MNEINITFYFKKAFEIYKSDFFKFIIAFIIVFIISVVSLGILAGPSIAGFFLMVLGRLRNKTQQVNIEDIFKGFNYFKSTLIFVILTCAIYFVGWLIVLILPLLLERIAHFLLFLLLLTISQFGIPLIVDKKVTCFDAYTISFGVVKKNFPLIFAFTIMWYVLGMIGIVFYIIGLFITMPFGICLVAVAYDEIFTKNYTSSQNLFLNKW